MKTVVFTFLMALLCFVSCLYLPWWSIAVVAFVLAVVFEQNALVSFSCAFGAVFLLWFGISFYLSVNNEHILANRVAMLIIKKESPWLLMLLTACLGGVVAGLAAITGSFFHPKRVPRVTETEILQGTQEFETP